MADERRMPFLEHLRELRTRIIYSGVTIIVSFIVAWNFHIEIFDWLIEPYNLAIKAMPRPLHQFVLSRVPDSGISIDLEQIPIIRYQDLVSPFFVYLKTSLLAAVFISVPVLFWQLWSFISPGLYPSERRLAAPFVIGTTVFFAAGVLFCRYVVLTAAVVVLLSIGAENTEAMIMMKDYFALVSRFLLVFGLVFEMPILVMFLALLGFVTHKTLIKHWKPALVLTFVVGAILTPPDPFTQIALALPLMALYALSIGVAYVFSLRRERRNAEVDV
jgi:sec-independent protein translocase protein TatC